MKNDDFYLFLNNVFDNSFNNNADNYIDYSKYSDAPHEFSVRHKRKMDKLIKRQKRFYFPAIKTGTRKFITITIILILMMFGTVMSVSAWRNAFFSFIVKPFPTHTDIKAANNHSAPLAIEENYEIGFVPDGFVLTEKEDIKELCSTRVYTKGNDRFDFEQWVRSEYDQGVDTEGYELEHAEINGCDGLIVNMEDVERCFISWDNGGYIFQIIGNIDIDTALKIAASVKKDN